MKYAVAMLVAGVVLMLCAAAMADWQVHEWDGRQWVPAQTPRGREAKINVEETACLLDLAGIAMFKPDGTRLQCRKVK